MAEGINGAEDVVDLSKKSRISTVRSLMTAKLRKGAISRVPPPATRDTWVRHVQRGVPFTVMAHDPHMPTRQAKR